ncbi:hypothetical protein C8R46DRAFT_1319145 [Mycena filopes]|nr:hypothetical protein C8R46DRAFT_1319145 [Mycena filopes]
MPGLPDTSLPILTAPLSPATAAKILLTIIGLVLFALSVRYASPAHQTGILSATMASLDKVFGDVASAGFSSVPPQDIPSILSAYDNISLLYGVLHLHGSMQGLRVQVGSLREERLQNSRAWSATLCEFLRGRSITLYCCIRKAKDLETRLKVQFWVELLADQRIKAESELGARALQVAGPAFRPPPAKAGPSFMAAAASTLATTD